MKKEELRKLKKEHKILKKTKIGWFYSPDKFEAWIEKMESKGYNLLRMSKLGNSFYFIKGEPRNMKYHVDFQNKKDSTYYKINQESGWKLFFTSVTRYFAISVWGQECDHTTPAYYSDKESKVKHAKKFALSYSIWMLPLSVMYLVMSLNQIFGIDFYSARPLTLITTIIFLLVSFEFLAFSYRLIAYYYRVKKSVL